MWIFQAGPLENNESVVAVCINVVLHNNSSERFSTNEEIQSVSTESPVRNEMGHGGREREQTPHRHYRRVSGQDEVVSQAPPSHRLPPNDDTHHQPQQQGLKAEMTSPLWRLITDLRATCCIWKLIESSRSSSTFSFDCSPRESCCLISAYSHVLYYPARLQFPKSSSAKAEFRGNWCVFAHLKCHRFTISKYKIL